MNDWRDFLIWWALSALAAATIVGAKIAFAFSTLAPEPPTDPELAKHWSKRRLWMAAAELSAIPAFATIGVVVTAHRGFTPISSVGITMALGAVGFTLLLDAAQTIFRIRFGISQQSKKEDGNA